MFYCTFYTDIFNHCNNILIYINYFKLGILFFTIKNCVLFQADEAFHIGAAASRESYLKMEKIIEVAIQSGAQVMNKVDTLI